MAFAASPFSVTGGSAVGPRLWPPPSTASASSAPCGRATAWPRSSTPRRAEQRLGIVGIARWCYEVVH